MMNADLYFRGLRMRGGESSTVFPNRTASKLGATRLFVLLVFLSGLMARDLAAANTPPTIGSIPNQTTVVDQPTHAIQLPINDAETAKVDLKMTATSSEVALT